MKTQIHFRTDRTGYFAGVPFALMPFDAGTNDPSTCSCYAHVGQHSSADLRGCIRASRAATEAEYAPLLRELTAIGYDVQTIKRVNHARAYAARVAQINAVRKTA